MPAWTSSRIFTAPSRAAPDARMMRAATVERLVACGMASPSMPVERDARPPLDFSAVALGKVGGRARQAELGRRGQLVVGEVAQASHARSRGDRY